MLTHAEVVSRLKAAIERADKATEGPWEARYYDGMADIVQGHEAAGYRVAKSRCSHEPCPAHEQTDECACHHDLDCAIAKGHTDGEFIAASRVEHPAAMKALLEIAERHKPSRLVDGPEFCRRCIQIGERLDLAAWPCCDFLAIAEAVRGMEA